MKRLFKNEANRRMAVADSMLWSVGLSLATAGIIFPAVGVWCIYSVVCISVAVVIGITIGIYSNT